MKRKTCKECKRLFRKTDEWQIDRRYPRLPSRIDGTPFCAEHSGLVVAWAETRLKKLKKKGFRERSGRRKHYKESWHDYLVSGWRADDWRQRYRQYLKTDQWKRRRMGAIDAADGVCQMCGGKYRLQVHHRHHENVGREEFADLNVLCANCHELRHTGNKHNPLGLLR
jgi:hypothetical protein